MTEQSNHYFESGGTLYINEDCRYIILVKTDAIANNNKFYELTIGDDDNSVYARWGRVDTQGQSGTYHGGFKALKSKAMEKFRKGYRPVDVVETVNVNIEPVNSKQTLKKLSVEQLTYVPKKALKSYNEEQINVVKQLIEHLVNTNKHEIMKKSGNKINVDESGLVKTPLGVLTKNAIDKAKNVLEKLKNEWSDFNQNGQLANHNYVKLLNEYLTLIPQHVPHSAGWYKTFFNSEKDFEEQYDFLLQLEDSVDMYLDMIENAKNNKNEVNNIEKPKLFNIQLKLVTDKKVIKSIEDYYENSKNDIHVSKDLKIVNIYEICKVDKNGKAIPNISDAFIQKREELGNMHLYWHGSRKYNILSILKNGLIIPKAGSFNVTTTRMFGAGVYFAKQSTKALNYSFGFWDRQNRIHDNHCFMFLADVVIGNPFKAADPKFYQNYLGKRNCYPIKGYDSTIATGNKSNLTNSGYLDSLNNHEFIVYNTDQINLRYLCEFKL